MRGGLSSCALLLAAGCFSPLAEVGDAVVSCSSDADCIADTACLAGTCRARGTTIPTLTLGAAETDEDVAFTFVPRFEDAGDAPTVELVDEPANGRAIIDGTDVRYVPDVNWHGSDSFSVVAVRAEDGSRSAAATAEITVVPIDDEPQILVPGRVEVDEDGEVTVDAIVRDVEDDDCTLDVTLVELGVVTVDGFSFTYRPNPDVFGGEFVFLVATCGTGEHAEATDLLSIDILPVDDDPRPVRGIARSVDEDDVVGVTLAAVEVDGEDVAFRIVEAPAHGALAGEEEDLARGLVLYRPERDFTGADSFSFCVVDVADAAGESADCSAAAATVALTVRPVDDPPRVLTDEIVLSAVGDDQEIVLAGEDVDGDVVTMVFSRAGAPLDDIGTVAGTLFTPRDHLVQRTSVARVIASTETASTEAIVPVRILGAASCAVAKMLDPDQGDGVFLVRDQVVFCDQTRRGGGFELVLKTNPALASFNVASDLWTDNNLLNPQSIGVDGGEAKLSGALESPVDDLLVAVIDPAGTIRAVDLLYPATIPSLTTLPERTEPRWTRALFRTLYADQNDQPCLSRLEETGLFGVLVAGTKIGGVGSRTCDGVQQESATIALGLVGASSGIQETVPALREVLRASMVFVRSRDFTPLGDADDCAAHARKGLLLPGTYLVGNQPTSCGVEPERGCGDGALDEGEACDDGDAAELNGCNTSCTFALCGNGIVERPEECEPVSVGGDPPEDCGSDCLRVVP